MRSERECMRVAFLIHENCNRTSNAAGIFFVTKYLEIRCWRTGAKYYVLFSTVQAKYTSVPGAFPFCSDFITSVISNNAGLGNLGVELLHHILDDWFSPHSYHRFEIISHHEVAWNMLAFFRSSARGVSPGNISGSKRRQLFPLSCSLITRHAPFGSQAISMFFSSKDSQRSL